MILMQFFKQEDLTHLVFISNDDMLDWCNGWVRRVSEVSENGSSTLYGVVAMIALKHEETVKAGSFRRMTFGGEKGAGLGGSAPPCRRLARLTW